MSAIWTQASEAPAPLGGRPHPETLRAGHRRQSNESLASASKLGRDELAHHEAQEEQQQQQEKGKEKEKEKEKGKEDKGLRREVRVSETPAPMINERNGVTLTRTRVNSQQLASGGHLHRGQLLGPAQDERLSRQSGGWRRHETISDERLDDEMAAISKNRVILGSGASAHLHGKQINGQSGQRQELRRKRRAHTQEQEENSSGGDGDGDGENNNKDSELLLLSLKCRVEKDLYLDFDEYQHYTCANCYK